MRTAELMTRDVVTLPVDATIGDAMEQMSERGVRHLPVVDQGTLVGVVSDRDLRAIEGQIAMRVGTPDAAAADPLALPVTVLLASDPITVQPDLPVDDLIDRLLEAHVSAVVVVDEKQRMQGMVSYVDILRAAKGKLG